MASTPSLNKEQAATGHLNRKQTPATPPANTLGDDDGSSDSSIPSDDDQFFESLKTELLSKKKFVLPPGFLAPLYRDCRPSAVEELVAPPRREANDGSSSPSGVTNSPKRRRSQNDEWKNNSTCSDNSVQPNIAEEINGHALQKGRQCNNNPVNPERERAKNIQSSSEFPSFFISMKPSDVTRLRGGRCLVLPGEFCKRHLPDKVTTIILKDENGVEYKTKHLSYAGRNSSFLSAGWAEFCDDHKLAVGDVLRFQLVNQTKFEVSIVKSNHQNEKVTEDEDAIFKKPRRNLKKGNGRPRGVPSTPPVVCIDGLTQRLEEAEAARHADKAVINDLQKKYDSIMAAMHKISPRVQAPDTLVPDVDSDETHQVTNQRKRRRCVKKVSTPTTSEDGSSSDLSPCSEDSSQLKKGRHCNSPPNRGSLERTKHIQSSSTPSFSISMKPSYVNGNHLGLPTKFCKHHLPDKDTNVILKGENGVDYKTTYLSRAGHGSLSAGWRVFSDDHKLAVGDVLRFQLVNQNQFEVFIKRSNQSDEVDGALFSNKSASGAKQKLERTKHIHSSSEFPSFSISMKPSYVNGNHLGLPTKFCKHHLPDKDTNIILKGENGVEYKTTYLSRAGHGSLSAGWRVFSDDHKLAVGDVLRFQLVNQTKFKVSIVKSNHQYEKVAEEGDAIFEKPRRNLRKRNVTNQRKRRRCVKKVSTPTTSEDESSSDHSPCSEDSSQLNIPEKGRHFNNPPNLESLERTKHIQSSSEFPSFSICLKPSYISRRGNHLVNHLTLPVEFSKHHLPGRDTTIILKDENGSEYETTYLSRAGSRRSSLGAGWPLFRDDHKLAVGDVLCFQLVNQTKFKVSIVKSNHQYEKVAEDGDTIFEKTRRNLRKRNGRPRVTNQRKRRRCVKKVSTPTTSEDGSSSDHSPCSEDSSQLNIPEKGRHCNNPLSPGSLERTKNIQSSSEFPSFSKSMKPSYVTGTGTHLFLPAKFCKHHLPDKNTTIILKGENGVEYKTKYLSCPGHWPSLSAGWRAFYKDHKLAVGDVLRFQLVNPTKFEVFIERSNQSDEVDEALFSKQSASGAKKNFITSDRAEKQKMKLEAKLNKISTAIEQLNGESKKLVKMRESVCHELKMLMRRVD